MRHDALWNRSQAWNVVSGRATDRCAICAGLCPGVTLFVSNRGRCQQFSDIGFFVWCATLIAVIFVFLGPRMVTVRLMLAHGRGWFSRVMGMFDRCCGNRLLMLLMMLMIVFVHGIHLVKLERGARARGKTPLALL